MDKRPRVEIIEQPVKASKKELDIAQATYDGALARCKRLWAAARTSTDTEAAYVRQVQAHAELRQADAVLDSAEDQHKEVLKVARNAHREEAQERALEAEVSEADTEDGTSVTSRPTRCIWSCSSSAVRSP